MDPYCFHVSDKEPRLKYQRSSGTNNIQPRKFELLQRVTPRLPRNLWVMPPQPKDAHLYLGAYLCIPEWLNRQSMQVPRLPDHPAPPSQVSLGCWLTYAIWGIGDQLTSSLSPHHSDLLHAPFSDPSTNISARPIVPTSCGTCDYLIIRND